ncbi:hypothetical protein IWW50_004788, partial [Coemansia erecta]
SDPERRTQLRRSFTRLFDASNPYLLFETLTSLLNAAVSARPRAPRWYVTLCGRFLTRVVDKYPDDGVRLCLDFLAGRGGSLGDEQLDRVAGLLLTPPAGADADAYWMRVVPQIRTLVCAPDMQEGVGQAAVFTLRRLAETHVRVFERLVALPVLGPLQRWFEARAVPEPAPGGGLEMPAVGSVSITASAGTQKQKAPRIEVIGETVASNDTERVVVSCSELGSTLDALQRLVLGGVPPVQLVSTLVVPVFAPLFHWLAFESSLEGQDSTVAADVRDVVTTTLRVLPAGAASATVLELVQHTRGGALSEWPVFARDVGGRAEVVWPVHSEPAASNEQHVVPVDTLVDVLGSEQLRELAGDVFLGLLREQEALVEMVEDGSDDADVARRWWMVSQVVLAVVDKLGPRVLARHADILAFILNILDRHAASTETNGGGAGAAEEADGGDTEASLDELMQALNTEAGGERDAIEAEQAEERRVGGAEMAVLALMLLGHIMSASESAVFAGQAAGINEAAAGPDASIPEIKWDDQSLRLLRRIRDAVGRVGKHTTPMVAKLSTATRHQVSLVLALHTGLGSESRDAVLQKEGDDVEVRRFNAALRDLSDDLVPVRAHGVIELRNMVLARSRVIFESEERLDAVVGVFVEHVRDSDSFVYLNAIRSLSSLADAYSSRFVPQLVSLYVAGLDQDQSSNHMDERLRVGEALLQCVQRAGAMLGEFAQHIVPALLNIVQREDNPVMLHSSLAILGEAAHTSPVALHRWIDEIAHTLRGVLVVAAAAGDEWVSVRRAAVAFWADLCSGYDGRLLELCDMRVLHDVYRSMKALEASDPDDLVRMHAQACIDQIDASVRGQLESNYLP